MLKKLKKDGVGTMKGVRRFRLPIPEQLMEEKHLEEGVLIPETVYHYLRSEQ
jgi:hypothetical protein